MNRLKQYLDTEEPQMPEGDYWVVETQSSYWVVSADTARAIERKLARLWRPRWVAFRDLSGGWRTVLTQSIVCLFESTTTQRAYKRAFERDRRREEKADSHPWEDD
jgi:hypothetical protein